jgi:hypothetical protein
MKLDELIVKLSDEQSDWRTFKELCREIMRYLSTKKIKDVGLFKKKTGTEYSTFYDSLEFPKEMLDDLLDNDEFIDLVLQESRKFRR